MLNAQTVKSVVQQENVLQLTIMTVLYTYLPHCRQALKYYENHPVMSQDSFTLPVQMMSISPLIKR